MEQDQNEIESRRKFLKTAGKFAIYTPPALMLISKSSHATFTKSNGHTGHSYEEKYEYISKFLDWLRNLWS